jgi:hypothetical protein
MTELEQLTVLIEECAAIHESGFDPDKRISAEALARYLLSNSVLLPPCKVGDYVKFTGSDEIWRVDCLHFYREGQPHISITRENVTHTITFKMFVNSGGKVICRRKEGDTT